MENCKFFVEYNIHKLKFEKNIYYAMHSGIYLELLPNELVAKRQKTKRNLEFKLEITDRRLSKFVQDYLEKNLEGKLFFRKEGGKLLIGHFFETLEGKLCVVQYNSVFGERTVIPRWMEKHKDKWPTISPVVFEDNIIEFLYPSSLNHNYEYRVNFTFLALYHNACALVIKLVADAYLHYLHEVKGQSVDDFVSEWKNQLDISRLSDNY